MQNNGGKSNFLAEIYKILRVNLRLDFRNPWLQTANSTRQTNFAIQMCSIIPPKTLRSSFCLQKRSLKNSPKKEFTKMEISMGWIVSVQFTPKEPIGLIWKATLWDRNRWFKRKLSNDLRLWMLVKTQNMHIILPLKNWNRNTKN